MTVQDPGVPDDFEAALQAADAARAAGPLPVLVSEHLWLGLLAQTGSPAARLAARYGITYHAFYAHYAVTFLSAPPELLPETARWMYRRPDGRPHGNIRMLSPARPRPVPDEPRIIPPKAAGAVEAARAMARGSPTLAHLLAALVAERHPMLMCVVLAQGGVVNPPAGVFGKRPVPTMVPDTLDQLLQDALALAAASAGQ